MEMLKKLRAPKDQDTKEEDRDELVEDILALKRKGGRLNPILLWE